MPWGLQLGHPRHVGPQLHRVLLGKGGLHRRLHPQRRLSLRKCVRVVELGVKVALGEAKDI